MSEYDFVLKNGIVVDPLQGINRKMDLAIKNKKINRVEDEINHSKSCRSINLEDKYVIPGIVDPHVHVSSEFSDKIGYRMMASKGVVTAIDLAGPPQEVFEDAKSVGCGLNIGVMNAITPEKVEKNLSTMEVENFINNSVDNDALGIKILGGHYPFSPEDTEKIISIANDMGIHVAFHAGTTSTGSDILGLEEATDLVGNNEVHLVHINSYCRGRVMDPIDEVSRAVKAIIDKENIFSESYLALINGTNAEIRNGEPKSDVTKNCLTTRNYDPTKEGLRKAILDGYGKIHKPTSDGTELVTGEEGLRIWLENDTRIGISFPVNSPISTIALAGKKDKEDNFVVDAISTDGGGIPRNYTVEKGLLLVKYGLLSIEDFVMKTSVNSAKKYNLDGKKDLSEGSDADITVIDLQNEEPVMTWSQGNLVLTKEGIKGKGYHKITDKDHEKS